jgi:predicted phosphoribosyltransferase
MEMELHRLMASEDVEMSIKDGPGEGTWSVFAAKVVEQRDELQREVARQAEEIERLARLTSSERSRCARARHLVFLVPTSVARPRSPKQLT